MIYIIYFSNNEDLLKNSYLAKKYNKLDLRNRNPLKPDSQFNLSKLIPFKYDKRHRIAFSKDQKASFAKFNSRLKNSKKIAKDSDDELITDFLNDGRYIDLNFNRRNFKNSYQRISRKSCKRYY